MTNTSMKDFTAWFPFERYAIEFVEWMGDGSSSYATNIQRRGRTVTWQTDNHSMEYFMGLLENVGYHGSTQNRKAKLNGIPAPISY